jgi:hypothetical protein
MGPQLSEEAKENGRGEDLKCSTGNDKRGTISSGFN